MLKKSLIFLLFLMAAGGAFARVVTQNGWISNKAGVPGKRGFNGDNRDALKTYLANPMGVAVDKWGNIYFSDTSNHRVRRVDIRTGEVRTVAGTGKPGFANDGSPADAAQLKGPTGLAFDRFGNLYIADTGNHRIRVLTVKGYLHTIAGDGRKGYTGESDRSLAASLHAPTGLAFNRWGELVFADTGNHRVRKIERGTGHVKTVAGNGYAGDDGDFAPAVNARLKAPTALLIDDKNNLFIADTGNHKVRWVRPEDKNIYTVAGTGQAGFSGEGDRKSTDSKFKHPSGLAMDKKRRLYISDTDNHRIRRVEINSMLDSKVQTLAGTGKRGYNGDDFYAWDAQISFPGALVITPHDSLYFVDSGNGLVRKVQGISTMDAPLVYTGFKKAGEPEDKRSFFEVLFGKNKTASSGN